MADYSWVAFCIVPVATNTNLFNAGDEHIVTPPTESIHEVRAEYSVRMRLSKSHTSSDYGYSTLNPHRLNPALSEFNRLVKAARNAGWGAPGRPPRSLENESDNETKHDAAEKRTQGANGRQTRQGWHELQRHLHGES